VHIHQSIPLLSIFSLKMLFTKDSLENMVLNCQVIFIYFSVGMKMVYRVHVYQRQSQIHGFKGVMNWLFKFYYIVF